MMTSSNGNVFRVTGNLGGEFTGRRWIPHIKASDAELWCFLWFAPKKGLSKQSWGWWFETPSRPLWRHSNEQCLRECLSNVTHCSDLIKSVIASQITGVSIVCTTVCSSADQTKHQSSTSLAFVRGPVNSRHKGPVTRKVFPFDDVVMLNVILCVNVSIVCDENGRT